MISHHVNDLARLKEDGQADLVELVLKAGAARIEHQGWRVGIDLIAHDVNENRDEACCLWVAVRWEIEEAFPAKDDREVYDRLFNVCSEAIMRQLGLDWDDWVKLFNLNDKQPLNEGLHWAVKTLINTAAAYRNSVLV